MNSHSCNCINGGLPFDLLFDLLAQLILLKYLQHSIELPLALVHNLLMRELLPLLFGLRRAHLVKRTLRCIIVNVFGRSTPVDIQSSFIFICSSIMWLLRSDLWHEFKSLKVFLIFIVHAAALSLLHVLEYRIILNALLGQCSNPHGCWVRKSSFAWTFFS